MKHFAVFYSTSFILKIDNASRNAEICLFFPVTGFLDRIGTLFATEVNLQGIIDFDEKCSSEKFSS